MSNEKGKLKRLKDDFKNYNDKLPVVTLNNGDKIKVKSGEWIKVLCSIDSENEHPVINVLKNHKIVEYTGNGNLPFLIMSLVESLKLRD